MSVLKRRWVRWVTYLQVMHPRFDLVLLGGTILLGVNLFLDERRVTEG